jgi:Uri superfamily endonuclease
VDDAIVNTLDILKNNYPDSGTYQLQIFVQSGFSISVGAIGIVKFKPGKYIYTGRASKNLKQRVIRHCKKDKQIRWHIDYLTSSPDVIVQSVTIISQDPNKECEVNQAIEKLAGSVIPKNGFGSSDCRSGCKSHLVKVESFPDSNHGEN